MYKGSLYYYIDSKEDLLFDIMERAHRVGLGLLVEGSALAAADAVSRLEAFIARWINKVLTGGPEMNIVERDVRYLSPERRVPIVEMRRQMNSFAQQLILQGVEEGIFDPSIDRLLAANSLFQLLNTTNAWYHSGGSVPMSAVTEWYQRITIRGLMSDAASGARTKRQPKRSAAPRIKVAGERRGRADTTENR
jgi:AcrR family transcriptional regulator